MTFRIGFVMKKLTWRRVLCKISLTPTGRPALSHYKSSEGHRIFKMTDRNGKMRGYKVEFRGRLGGMIPTLQEAKWAVEYNLEIQALDCE